MIRAFALLLSAVFTVGCGNGSAVPEGSVDPATPGWTLHPPAEGATPVTAARKMPGQYPAGSRIEDRKAPGGFGPCDNYPHTLAGQTWGSPGEVSLVASPEESVAYFKYRGFALRVINRSSGTVPLQACDSMLSIIRQARDADGRWRDVETPVGQICGNSVHQVFLPPGQYWQFPAREYAGPIKTKLRFRLDLGDGRPTVYSNEFDGRITAAQLAEEQVKPAAGDE